MRLVAVLLAAVIVACSHDPDGRVRQATDGALSWASSAHLAVEGWREGRLSGRSAAAVLERSQAGLEERRTSLASAPDAARPRLASAASTIAEMSHAAAELRRAVADGDRSAADRGAARLAASAGRLRQGLAE